MSGADVQACRFIFLILFSQCSFMKIHLFFCLDVKSIQKNNIFNVQRIVSPLSVPVSICLASKYTSAWVCNAINLNEVTVLSAGCMMPHASLQMWQTWRWTKLMYGCSASCGMLRLTVTTGDDMIDHFSRTYIWQRVRREVTISLAAEQWQVSSTEWWMTRAAMFFIYRNL